MFLWEWLVWKWLLITSLRLGLFKWWSMHQAKSLPMSSRLHRNFVHTSSKSQSEPIVHRCSKMSNDKKETFVSYPILIHFNVPILHMSWKHSQISLFNSSVHEKVDWNALPKSLNQLMLKWHTGKTYLVNTEHLGLKFSLKLIQQLRHFRHILPFFFYIFFRENGNEFFRAFREAGNEVQPSESEIAHDSWI